MKELLGKRKLLLIVMGRQGVCVVVASRNVGRN